MKTVTRDVAGQTITATLQGNNLVISDPHSQLITFAAERLPALAAALQALASEEPSELVVLKIAHTGDWRRLHVQMAAATEMSFEVVVEPGGDYDKLIADICRVAPVLMRLDSHMMEVNDDPGSGVRPRYLDQQFVGMFVARYRAQIKNAQLGLAQFRGLEGE